MALSALLLREQLYDGRIIYVTGGPDSSPDEWSAAASRAFADHPVPGAEALQRLLNFMCASQLYLRGNFRLDRPLDLADVKPHPSGHWGVCPPTNHVLAALGPMLGIITPAGHRARVLHGAGHAGPSLRAWSYLSGGLGTLHPEYTPGREGYENLTRDFPGKLGGEITPLLPGIDYMGGQIGCCLAFAQGLALGTGDLVIPLVGDGECETGETAAGWLAGRHSMTSQTPGAVLPIVLLNGFRMGSRSLLGSLPPGAVRAYFEGLGYIPVYADGSSIAGTRAAFLRALRLLADHVARRFPVVLLTMPKGDTCPESAGGKRLAGTPGVHKAPLRAPAGNLELLAELEAWLRSYDPGSVLDECLAPAPQVAAVPESPGRPARESRPARPSPLRPVPAVSGDQGFREAVVELLEARARQGRIRVFSPDEFTSNLAPPLPGGALQGALTELLNEQVCHAWLEGHLTAGGEGLFVGYEGFSALTATHLTQYAKKLHLLASAGRRPARSLTYLLSSTCWENSYTHQDPGLLSLLLARDDPLTRIFTPATVRQCLAILARCLDDFGHVNVIVFSKRAAPAAVPLPPSQLAAPWSVWPARGPSGDPRLALVAIGNVMAAEVAAAARYVAEVCPELPVRLASINDLSAAAEAAGAGSAGIWQQLGRGSAVLVATATHAAPIRGLIARALPGRRTRVAGYHDPGRPLCAGQLLRECGCDAESLAQTALKLVAKRAA